MLNADKKPSRLRALLDSLLRLFGRKPPQTPGDPLSLIHIYPLEILTASSRALARGDFSQRVHLWSRTEIGELAETFNTMSQELEHFVEDLKRAAEENRALFLGSIQMLAGAVDEKDPYTRGHSDRVTRYSLMIAKEMALPPDFLETLQISAQLHDVGKIGIEDLSLIHI